MLVADSSTMADMTRLFGGTDIEWLFDPMVVDWKYEYLQLAWKLYLVPFLDGLALP